MTVRYGKIGVTLQFVLQITRQFNESYVDSPSGEPLKVEDSIYLLKLMIAKGIRDANTIPKVKGCQHKTVINLRAQSGEAVKVCKNCLMIGEEKK